MQPLAKSISMIFLLILPIFFALISDRDLTHLLTPFSKIAHEICLNNVPQTNLKPLYSSLICGAELNESELQNLFRSTGLFHLVVVSGAHLTFLESLFSYIRKLVRIPENLILLFLVLYAFACQLNPPVVRALIALFLRKWNSKFHWHWSAMDQTFLTGLLCLSFFPHWIGSWSLLLSWLAAIAIHWPLQHESTSKRACLVYVFLLPVMCLWSTSSPIHILCNILFTPVFSVVLFPLSILTALLPLLNPLTDFCWQIFLSLLRLFELPNFAPEFHSLKIFSLWLYVFALQSFAHFYSVTKTRAILCIKPSL